MLTVQQYNKLKGQVLQAISSNTKISDVDTEFDRDALRNLHDQFMVRHLKEASKSVYMMKFKILNRVAAGESLLAISKEYGISS